MTISFRFIIIGCLTLSSCGVSNEISDRNNTDSIITITASNLSEDGSLFSTQEDELLVLVYHYIDSKPAETLISEKFTFNKSVRSYTMEIDTQYSKVSKLITLIELDGSRSIVDISNQVREHYRSLIRAFKKHDLSTIEMLLGDEDLLGIQVTGPQKRLVHFQGTWRMDRYEYQIRFQ